MLDPHFLQNGHTVWREASQSLLVTDGQTTSVLTDTYRKVWIRKLQEKL